MADQAYSTSGKDSSEFDIPSSMEVQIRKLKLNLENWREIVLLAKNVFIWEKNWHPTALIGGSTILFMFLWLLDPSILTVVSILGLSFTVCDYLVPSLASTIFKPEKWTAKNDNDFEAICTNIVLYRARLELAWESYYKMKITNRKMYFLLTTITLVVLAWIGCSFNNLFLAYLLVNFILLLPGMEHNGIMNKWRFYVQSFLNECFKQAKSKVTQEKND